jgi:peptide alpha-N-acetyltransferase
LVIEVIRGMKEDNAEEVVLETEITNLGALGLYQNLGFVKDKRLSRYYMNGVDAFRLKLFLAQ